MLVFDAGSRYLCTVERQTTNSPQQALVLLNDPQFVEASRLVAERMMTQGGTTPDDRIQFAFRLLTSRKANEAEIKLLNELYQEELDNYRKDLPGALALLSVGDHKRNTGLDVAALAANSVVASIIMNHDESYTKR